MNDKKFTESVKLNPHRCAFLLDDVVDAISHWEGAKLMASLRTFRHCLKNKEINADMLQQPQYVKPKENYEDLFDEKKVREKAEKAREAEKLSRNKNKEKTSEGL